MRIVKDIPHPRFKITVFSWNNKYIIKIEDAHLEQIYKIDEAQVSSLAEFENILSTPFLLKVLKRFSDMSEDFSEAWNYRFSTSNSK
ncbi:hypothetical protein G3O08_08945 [Cryomorpha ignava]|uniref:Uncharacterized protein n=1 Tax=Cryomorpha ignava TaxID=101383 RepID=A0A7K3WPQ3_9FLAO|nr:hypothetical protein [Cryomorpha ignava]NEN23627.1 hypothetical protein [Cryomorpha ignava]